MPQVAVGEATEEVWASFFSSDKYTDKALAMGVRWCVDELKDRNWPTPATVRDYVRKYQAWAQGQAVDEIECRACNGVGLVPTDDYRGLGVPGMTTCFCPYGRSKALWLEEERRKGRAWTGEQHERDESHQTPDESAEQEEIPF